MPHRWRLRCGRIRGIDPNMPIFSVRTLQDIIERNGVVLIRIIVLVFAATAFMGFFLALVGLCAIVSYQVGQRTREIGPHGSGRGAHGGVADDPEAVGHACIHCHRRRAGLERGCAAGASRQYGSVRGKRRAFRIRSGAVRRAAGHSAVGHYSCCRDTGSASFSNRSSAGTMAGVGNV
jgi:hypothetical protein